MRYLFLLFFFISINVYSQITVDDYSSPTDITVCDFVVNGIHVIDDNVISLDNILINCYLGDSITTGNDASMDGAGNWITSTGGLNPDVSTTPGYMTLDFISGNQAVRINNAFTGINDFQLHIRCRVVPGSGDNMAIRIGRTYQTGLNYDYFFDLVPDTIFRVYKYTVRDGFNDNFYIGALGTYNTGAKFEIDYINTFEINSACEANEVAEYSNLPISSNGGRMIDSIQSFSGDLCKVGIIGNSIMANYYGGSISAENDEGAGERPPRLTINSVPRRIYDTIFSIVSGYNKATYRRSDHVDWTLNGAWTSDNGTAVNGVLINPPYTAAGGQTVFNYSIDPSAYAEITIPDGYENAVLIYHKGFNNFTNINEDSIFVTLNGGSINNYGDTLINTYLDYLGSFYRGNPYAMSEYYDLPSGNNIIRLTKGGDSNTFTFWGVMYWTGRTIAVLNYAMSGYSMEDYWDFTAMQEDRGDNNYYTERSLDFILWELPGINENSDANSLNKSVQYYELFINAIKPVTAYSIFTTHPTGCIDVGCSVNYYTLYDDPVDLERRYQKLYYWSYWENEETYNIFDDFKYLYNANGHTLISGEGAIDYTADGAHLNEEGASKFMEYLLRSILK